jgi:trehalose-6-phosphatase
MKGPPFAQRIALFIGDDVTDESVFAALPALGGRGYSVGREVVGVEGTFGGPQDHHGEAAKHHDAGHHEKAAHHAHTARGHAIHARKHAEDAVMAHTEEHGKK